MQRNVKVLFEDRDDVEQNYGFKSFVPKKSKIAIYNSMKYFPSECTMNKNETITSTPPIPYRRLHY
jgi:hypothetical protein